MMDLEFHQLELKYADLRLHDRRHQSRLVASVAEHGQQSPVLVVSATTHRYVLIDGYQRVGALQQLGRDTVQALELPMSEVEALYLSHRQDTARRRTALEDGWFVRELVQRHGVNQTELGRKLGRSTSWVSRRLALVCDLPDSVQELVRTGQLCPHAAMRYLVPLARANTSQCEQLAAALAGEQVSARQLRRLYVTWRVCDAAERERLIEQPLLYLKADAAVVAGDEAQTQEQQLRHDLELVQAVSLRATHRLREKLTGPLPLVFDGVWQRSWAALVQLREQMQERIHARSGHTDRGV